jgi:peptidoglycan/xylan/chitin deacetylase (PgdA/CDA1 family)
MYHRVAETRPDPWSLCVAPHHFAEHLEVVGRLAHPMRLTHLVEAMGEGTVPAGAVVITFDDGYADNCVNAQVLLERSDVPATVFLVTGQIGQSREFWWDELERVLLEPGSLPERLDVSIRGRRHEWSLGTARVYRESEAQRHVDWRANDEPPTARQRVFRELWALLRGLRHEERLCVLDDLAQWAGLPGTSARLSHRCLLDAEVRALASGGLIEIGAHTVTHPFLPDASRREQIAEIQASKAAAEELATTAVLSFSYPHGAFSEETLELVRASGFACAVSTVSEPVSPSSSALALPRMQVEDWNGEEFAERLSSWLGC